MPDRLRSGPVQLVLAVLVLAAVGAVAGVVWQWVWTPPVGIVLDHEWIPVSETSISQQFSATGWYVVVGSLAGLVGGLLAALLLDRHPLLTLLGVLLGAVLGAWLMYVVGVALGPADHVAAARTAAEGTELPRALSISGASPWLAVPAGALVGVALVFLGMAAVERVQEEPERPEPVSD